MRGISGCLREIDVEAGGGVYFRIVEKMQSSAHVGGLR